MFHVNFAFIGIGTNELLIFAVIALLLFGTRLPKIARSFGQSVTEFKKGIREAENGVVDETTAEKSETEPHC